MPVYPHSEEIQQQHLKGHIFDYLKHSANIAITLTSLCFSPNQSCIWHSHKEYLEGNRGQD
jgi:hypothetical protein